MIELLDKYGKIAVALLQSLVPKATGKTANSIRYEVYPERLVVFGRAYFQTLETGRGPRKDSSYGGFDKSLLEWMAARGIGAGLTDKKKQQLARFLSYKINKEGDKTFKAGGKDVYSVAVAKFIEELKKEVIKMKTKEYTAKMVAQLKTSVNGTVSN